MNSLSDLHNFHQDFIKTHPDAVPEFRDAIERVLADAGLAYDRVSVRIKSWRSLRAKIKKKHADGSPVYPNPIRDIHDLIGVRITTYHSTEIPQIIEALSDEFTVRRSVDKAEQARISGTFGYGSHHLIVEVDSRTSELSNYMGQEFEVQIRTVLQHAWAEFEHDIRYKRRSRKLSPQVDRAFTLAAGLIELADQQFDQIAAIEEPRESSAADPGVEFTAETLPGIITMINGNQIPQSSISSYQWLEELLHAHEIRTAGQLEALLSPRNITRIREAMNYKFRPGHVRVIDDLLLAQYGREHIRLTGSSGKHPKQRVHRLERSLPLVSHVF
ncbi:GTP pyrophosphokinase family protein [Corynebacterium sp. ES2794-CONJ1]|uniref:GTP pyrophosphokinase n=1 Tax=unclassified Corynebacterium TaxID=2624378 RepID=UPI002169AB6E|nr:MULTISPECIES: GTP pyrophosphokinase family protein [unclassified Corynebacterium]MCS4490854.1 GTP pyrophosphokinase family protein [Corynebacterium sp. ES2715-CONJ3]MCS4531263.1 GTP pyrophosphokinase family protein [Corynebacterium sp. ES2730-CONJ]MCU9518632.1 GTP pyrophosphokinase family protein [Corynebacterium sp. ES2794-CONJ1]